mmetsp:Transcript_97721/g.276502  ORF Transcript_97721/g.276502 Transcript_97721/m.276502 type:complete len:123 (+) Transcript_97721:114-482(+)
MDEEDQRRLQTAQQSLREVVRSEACLIFSTTVCPWCDRAAEFFESIKRPCRKIELDVPRGDGDHQMLGLALAMATRQQTVPNIFLVGKHLGGYDVLMKVHKQCKAGRMVEEHADVCHFLLGE